MRHQRQYKARPGLVLAALCASLALLALVASTASASPPPRTEVAQITGFRDPKGITVNSAGDVWVISEGHVEEFAPYPSNEKIGELDAGGHLLSGSFQLRNLAANDANESLYFVNGGSEIAVFNAAQEFVFPGWVPEGVGGFADVAADNSGGAKYGDVYLTTGSEPAIQAFTADHHPADFTASAPYIEANKISGEFSCFGNAAVDTEGNIYCGDDIGSSEGRTTPAHKIVNEFTPNGEFIQDFSIPNAPGGESAGIPAGIAIDPTNGNVLIDTIGGELGGEVFEFNSVGVYLDKFGAGVGEGEIAINSAGYVYLDGDGTVQIYSPNLIPPRITAGEVTDATHVSGVVHATVDPHGAGNVTACHVEYGTTSSYGQEVPCSPDPAGANFTEPTEVHAELSGLTVATTYHYRVLAENTTGALGYGADQTFTPQAVLALSTDAATNVTANTAQLNASYQGEGKDTKFHFEYGTSIAYGHNTPTEDNGESTGPQTLTPVSIAGLTELTTYHYRVVAENEYGISNGPDRTFETADRPSIEGVSTSGLGPTSADLDAKVNPNGLETTYHFEYGTTTAYGTTDPVPDEVVGADHAVHSVSVHLEDLQLGATYHFRLIATNSFGTATSEDQTFNFYPPSCPNAAARQQTGSNALPDCRAYELASPDNSGSAVIFPVDAPPSTGLATSPSRLAYGTWGGVVPGIGHPSNTSGDLYIATRTANGWVSRYIGLPAEQAYSMGNPPWTFNEQHENANPAFSQHWVLTDSSLSTVVDWDDGHSRGTFGTPTFAQGASDAPYVWDSATGDLLGRWPTNLANVPEGEAFTGETAASADLSHFVFSSDIPFVLGGVPGDLYDDNTQSGELSIVSRTPSNAHLEGASPVKLSANGSHILIASPPGECVEEQFEEQEYIHRCPVPIPHNVHLYMRINDAVTDEIAPGHSVNFVSMTSDGSKAYFTSEEQLTTDDHDSSTDLYMWSEKGEEERHPLTLISKGDNEGNAGEPGNTDACAASWTEKCGIGTISFIRFSEIEGGAGGNGVSDSSTASASGDIYFFSPEQLVGDKGVAGRENLFLYRGGSLRYVTTFAPERVCFQPSDQNQVCSEGPIARMDVSPDGSHMAFVTNSRITKYNNADHTEMYSYASATGQLTCDSCLPDGEPPTSEVFGAQNGLFMTNDGRAFFSTEDSLVPADTNRAEDVYEYVGGRPQLLTGGNAVANNTFGLIGIATYPGLVGVSANGADAYFSTFEVLVPQDENGQEIKIYDARTNGGFPDPAPPPPCAAADECHGEGSSPPPTPTEATGAFLGTQGNVHPQKKATPKHRKHQRAKSRRRHPHPRHAKHRRGAAQ